MFPTAASTVALQADLTAVAGGPVAAQTAATLDRLAEPTADPAGGQNDSVVTVRRVPELPPAAVTAVTADGIVDVTTPDAGQVGPGILAARLHVAPLPSRQQVQVLIDRLRDADSGLGFTRLPDEEVRLLAEAAEHGTAVWIKYESVFSTSGKTSWLLLDELHIEPRQVVGWCRTRQKEESFPLYSIRLVELA